MNKKQKKNLKRIIVSALILAALLLIDHFTEVNPILMRLLYLIPYWIIGNDVLKKALHGIQNKEVFDENFLMAVATIGAMILGEVTEGVAVMLFSSNTSLFCMP